MKAGEGRGTGGEGSRTSVVSAVRASRVRTRKLEVRSSRTMDDSLGGSCLMKLWSILGNSQRLDGGAMFGNAPKACGRNGSQPDADNRIPLACRALLVEGSRWTKRAVRNRHRRVFRAEAARALRRGRRPPRAARLAARGRLRHTRTSMRWCCRICISIMPAACWRHGRKAAGAALLFPNATYIVGRRCWQRALTAASARSRLVHPRTAAAAARLRSAGTCGQGHSLALRQKVRFVVQRRPHAGADAGRDQSAGAQMPAAPTRRGVLRRPDSRPALGALAGDDGLRPQRRSC